MSSEARSRLGDEAVAVVERGNANSAQAGANDANVKANRMNHMGQTR